MPYRLVKGSFHLFYQGETRHVGSRPDGDSMWIEPDDPGLLGDLQGRSADFNGGGYVNLRFEGIDALELHYEGSHQSLQDAKASRDATLAGAGFDRVEFSTTSELALSVRDAEPHPVRGYILTKNVDPFGRPVAFVFAGATARADGSEVFLREALLDRSINAQLMRGGLAYPGFYTSLPWDLRDRLSAHASSAWERGRGIWATDVSREPTRIPGIDELEELVLWPKLFRRLVTYFREGNRDVGGFEPWLRADPDRDDELWIIPRATPGHLHDAVEVSSNRIRMTFWPEELVIVPR